MVCPWSWCRASLSPGDRFYILAVPGLRSTTAIIFICCAELSAVPVWTLGHLANILGSSIVREHPFVTEKLGNKEEGSFSLEHSFRALSVQKMIWFIRVILNFHCACLNFHFCG